MNLQIFYQIFKEWQFRSLVEYENFCLKEFPVKGE